MELKKEMPISVLQCNITKHFVLHKNLIRRYFKIELYFPAITIKPDFVCKVSHQKNTSPTYLFNIFRRSGVGDGGIIKAVTFILNRKAKAL